MAGELKNRQHYGVTIDIKILVRFRELAESTRIPQSRLLDEALNDLLRKYEKGSN
jgi:hypothetical protein